MNMKVAIPVAAGRLTAHFGHCEQFAIVDVDDQSRTIKGQVLMTPPPHEPGVLPSWLAGLNVNVVIAGGMGQRAQQLFRQNGIEVLCGAPTAEPEQLVQQYLGGQLDLGANACDH
jgi:ATP-binding protein involved in chromosome partitioning